jgi:predicted metal-binding membrane protein
MDETTAMETLVRRDRAIACTGLGVIAVLAWWWIVVGAGTGMNAAAMTSWAFPPTTDLPSTAGPWDMSYWALMAAMWWVMMIAMMVPSATPMILLYARVARQGQRHGQIDAGPLPTGAFAFGYLAVWLSFSLVATGLQAAAEQAGLLHSVTMGMTTRWLSAGLLVAAGVYQLSPLKTVCLRHCRSPAQFLARHWRQGTAGAFRMGLDHGAYCVGCCWFLMALLFAGGIMNLVWIAGLAVLVLVEKLAPGGHWTARVSGTVLIAGGLYVAVAGVL